MSKVTCRLDGSHASLSCAGVCLRADLPTGTFELEVGGKCIVPRAVSAATFAGGAGFRTDEAPTHAARIQASGAALEIEHGAADDGPALVQRFTVDASSGGLLFELILHVGRTSPATDRLHHLIVEGRRGEASAFEPGGGLWMWRFGAASPGDPVLFLPLDSPDVPHTHDRDRWLIEEGNRLSFTSEMLACFRSGASGRTCFIGFASVCDQAAGFSVSRGRERHDRVLLESRCDLEGLALPPGAEVHAETLLILPETDPWQAAETYAQVLARRYRPRIPKRPLTGWSDWQYYRRESTEKAVIENVEALAAGEYPVEYVLVDDGYQRNMSDWLVPNERFPDGIRWLAGRIREKGFKPGVWIAPLTAHESSALVHEHPDWLLRDACGNILTYHTHMGRVHVIDFTVPEALDGLRSLVRTLVGEYGFRWIKLDGPIRRYYAGGVFRNGPMTSVRHIRMALETIREAAGDAIIEGEGYYGPSIALVDTQRVTQDIQQAWPRLRHTAQVNLLSTFMHRRWWINNPDAFILRDAPSPACSFDGEPEHVMTTDELRTEITALTLTGGVVMLTDRMTQLTDERKALVDAFLPVYETAARPIDLFNGKTGPEVFHQKVTAADETYDVVAVFNWEDEPRRARVQLAGIDLEKAERHVAFEYWTQTFLGTVERELEVGEIPPHGVRLMALRPRVERPFVMGTSLHVTQGGVELSRQGWDERKGRLRFSLSSWARCPRLVHVHVPDALVLEAVRCTSKLLSHDLKSPHHLLVEYEAGGTVPFDVSFRPRA